MSESTPGAGNTPVDRDGGRPNGVVLAKLIRYATRARDRARLSAQVTRDQALAARNSEDYRILQDTVLALKELAERRERDAAHRDEEAALTPAIMLPDVPPPAIGDVGIVARVIYAYVHMDQEFGLQWGQVDEVVRRAYAGSAAHVLHTLRRNKWTL